MSEAIASDDDQAAPGEDEGFETLLMYLKEARGFDFTGYKRSSLVRRVNRRMEDVPEVSTYGQYLDYLEVHPEEFAQLFNTILINVTDFFRDLPAWEHLRRELLPRVQARRHTESIRVWSAGCASGQEAYSAAILLAEALGPEEFANRVKVYATDIDEDALTQARHATYAARQVESLGSDRLARWFTEQPGGQYVVRKDLRRNVIFGRNDLVQDAPISRVDLLLCRNTLMYFNAETQARVLSRMHFALKPDGILFLGRAEMLLGHQAAFAPLDLKQRLFAKVPDPEREMPARPVAGITGFDRVRDDAPAVQNTAWLAGPMAQVVLDADLRVAASNDRAEALLGVTAREYGRLLQDTELSFRPAELRPLVEKASVERKTAWQRGVDSVRAGGERLSLDVEATPLLARGDELVGVLVTYHDVTPFHRLRDELEHTHRQLETSYEELQSTNEELETTNEELQSTVEELETTNEELQSTNEELETMNEELQSVNDELHVTNEQLAERTGELDALNRFLESILSSLSPGVLVVGRDWRVQAWNRRAEDLWGVRGSEATGEHLLNLDIGLPVEALRPLVREVFDREPGAREEPRTADLDAVNRRGRALTVRVTVRALDGNVGEPAGAIVIMEPVDA